MLTLILYAGPASCQDFCSSPAHYPPAGTVTVHTDEAIEDSHHSAIYSTIPDTPGLRFCN